LAPGAIGAVGAAGAPGAAARDCAVARRVETPAPSNKTDPITKAAFNLEARMGFSFGWMMAGG
jgi:hypothetical protein